MPYIPTEKVESSNIEAIGYHRQSTTLRIIFQGGRAYDYPMVPEQEYKRLMQAESKGKFFNSRIKPMYGHRTPRPEELEPPPEPCCNHPDKACNAEDCGNCDPDCCPQEMAHTGAALAHGVDRGKRLMEETRTAAVSGVPPAFPRTAEGEIDYEAIPNATVRVAEATGEVTHLDTCPDPCPLDHAVLQEEDEKACTHPNKEATEDGSIVGCAVCGADLSPDKDEGEPTDEETMIDAVCRCCNLPIRIPTEDAVDLCAECHHSKGGDSDEPCTVAHPLCPHGADGRNCDTSCICTCHPQAKSLVSADTTTERQE